jgi:hypothetical protein
MTPTDPSPTTMTGVRSAWSLPQTSAATNNAARGAHSGRVPVEAKDATSRNSYTVLYGYNEGEDTSGDI